MMDRTLYKWVSGQVLRGAWTVAAVLDRVAERFV